MGWPKGKSRKPVAKVSARAKKLISEAIKAVPPELGLADILVEPVPPIPRCSNCLGFMKGPDADQKGWCRRHATAMSCPPVVTTYDWCEDWRLDERKV